MEKKIRVEGEDGVDPVDPIRSMLSSSPPSSSSSSLSTPGPFHQYRYFYSNPLHRQLESAGDPATGDLVHCLNYFSPNVCYFLWFNHFAHKFVPDEMTEEKYRWLYPQLLLLYYINAASAGRADIVLCRPEYQLTNMDDKRVLILHTLLCGRLALASDICNLYFGFTLTEASPVRLQLLSVHATISNAWESFVKFTEDTMEIHYNLYRGDRRGVAIMHSAMNSPFTTPEILCILEKIYPECKLRPPSSGFKQVKSRNRFLTGLWSAAWADGFLSRTLEEGTERFNLIGDKSLLDEYVSPMCPDIRMLLKKEAHLHTHPCYKMHLFADRAQDSAAGASLSYKMKPPTSLRQRQEIQEWVDSVLLLAMEYVGEDPELSQVKIGNYAPQLCMIEKLTYLKHRGLDIYDLCVVMLNVLKQWRYDETTLTSLSPSQMKALCKVYDEGDVRAVQKILAERLKNPGVRLVWDPLDPEFLPFEFSFRGGRDRGQKRKATEEEESAPATAVESPLTTSSAVPSSVCMNE